MNTFKCWLIAQTEGIFGMVLFLGFMLTGAIDKMVTPPEFLMSTWFFVTVASFALIPSLIIMIFTWKHFEEVISRSLIWRKSNVDRFSLKLKYTSTIFIQVLIIFIAIPYEISVVIIVL